MKSWAEAARFDASALTGYQGRGQMLSLTKGRLRFEIVISAKLKRLGSMRFKQPGELRFSVRGWALVGSRLKPCDLLTRLSLSGTLDQVKALPGRASPVKLAHSQSRRYRRSAD